MAATTLETGFIDRAVTHQGQRFRYQVYVPRQYDASEPVPAILFLHGGGERGDDGLLQTEVGLGSAIRRYPQRFPAITIFPQAPKNARWRDLPAHAAMATLDATVKEFSVDPNRVYLTGLSLGGEGSWYAAYHHLERFAAMLVICGFVGSRGDLDTFVAEGPGTPYERLAERLKTLPIWVFHGEADSLVPVDESRRMVDALRAHGSTVLFSELPGINHNSWDAAYQSESVAAWLFAQRRR